MKKDYKKYNQSGFTLLEVILVLALIGIVVSIAPSLHIFGIKAFTIGENKSNVQFDARMAADAITREIRYASQVEILEANPATIEDGYSYIYSEDSGGSQAIIYKDKTSSRTIASFTKVQLDFSTLENKTLNFIIDGEIKGETFFITSEVIPLNMKSITGIINNEGIAIKYKIKDDNLGAILLEPAPPNSRIGLSYDHLFTASGGTAPYIYSLDSGNLPDDLTLTGDKILGTPSLEGSYEFTIKVEDSSTPKLSATRTFIIEIGSILTAQDVADKINVGDIVFPDPKVGDEDIHLPEVPVGFDVYIHTTDPITLVTLDGTINPPESSETVKIKLVVINTVDSNDPYGYTNEITKTIPAKGTNAPPIAENLKITNLNSTDIFSVGSKLIGTYTYKDNENDPEGDTIYRWYRSNFSNGTNRELIASGVVEYTLTQNEFNKYIYFEVTPKDTSGLEGSTKLSEPTYVINNQQPNALNIAILKKGTSTPVNQVKAGEELTASYTYFDAEFDEEDTTSTIYTWYRTNKIDGNLHEVYKGKNYIVQNDNNISYIYLGITIKAKTGNINPVTVTTAYVQRIN